MNIISKKDWRKMLDEEYSDPMMLKDQEDYKQPVSLNKFLGSLRYMIFRKPYPRHKKAI